MGDVVMERAELAHLSFAKRVTATGGSIVICGRSVAIAFIAIYETNLVFFGTISNGDYGEPGMVAKNAG